MKKIPFNLGKWLQDKSQKVVTRDGRGRRQSAERKGGQPMKDTIIKLLLILLAIVITMTAGLATIAVARYAGAIFGRWAEITYIVVVGLAALCVVLFATIPDRGENNGV